MVNFVNNNPTRAQKLVSIICVCGWLGWKSIIFSSSSCVFCGEIAKTDFSFLLPQGNHFIFPSRFSNSDFTLKKGGSFSNTSAVLANIQQNLLDSAPLALHVVKHFAKNRHLSKTYMFSFICI